MRYLYFSFLILLMACSYSLPEAEKIDSLPTIFPDYTDVTVPPNVAPLNFKLTTGDGAIRACLQSGEEKIIVGSSKGKIQIPLSGWNDLLAHSKGKSIQVTVYAKQNNLWKEYKSFSIHVAEEEMDPYITYRLIEPGYELWNKMGIYQRHLENFTQSAIMENKMTGNNCMNCHSFCMQDPDKMLFHMRATYPGTFLINGDKIEKLNTKTEQTISNLVYPSWHPGGRYVAFSVNNTKQAFHMNDRNRVEVFDEASDVVVYDSENHEIVTTPVLFSKERWETFPTFSPDGKTLYFCSAAPRSITDFKEIKYSLCAVSFDPQSRKFGSVVDTLYNANDGKSASFPRVSPDGNYLLYTLSGYGNFSIWHKDADLYLIDLKSATTRAVEEVNSDDVESYHSWSSNSRWFVFSSRRIDGLYTRPYFAYLDKNGKAGKPFLLPQKDPDFYHNFMKSYNVPEFIKGKVKKQSRSIAVKAKNDPGVDVKFVK
ncbi:hypothetical protein [Massilibacteroides sp.]|uniref:TolB family protein n=1 Tax=Massilibacteroides sp. TaxID=2034766 RepID=UPI0026211E5D|nr:hypothetical protein [Massilibacteroides sp.]MDD4516675.1 hypothetical protein [Massilibacteroides sp.]